MRKFGDGRMYVRKNWNTAIIADLDLICTTFSYVWILIITIAFFRYRILSSVRLPKALSRILNLELKPSKNLKISSMVRCIMLSEWNVVFFVTASVILTKARYWKKRGLIPSETLSKDEFLMPCFQSFDAGSPSRASTVFTSNSNPPLPSLGTSSNQNTVEPLNIVLSSDPDSEKELSLNALLFEMSSEGGSGNSLFSILNLHDLRLLSIYCSQREMRLMITWLEKGIPHFHLRVPTMGLKLSTTIWISKNWLIVLLQKINLRLVYYFVLFSYFCIRVSMNFMFRTIWFCKQFLKLIIRLNLSPS